MRGPRVVAVSLAALLAAGCGGGSGSSSPVADAMALGLVPGALDSRHAVELTNPLSTPAIVRTTGDPPSFRIDPSTLPVEPVAAGASFTCDVIVHPSAPGEIRGDVPLDFHDGTSGRSVLFAFRATVEEVRVTSDLSRIDFGAAGSGYSQHEGEKEHQASDVFSQWPSLPPR